MFDIPMDDSANTLAIAQRNQSCQPRYGFHDDGKRYDSGIGSAMTRESVETVIMHGDECVPAIDIAE